MPRNASEIDRLIEEGLTRYGTGDVDGALAVWEMVLVTDPGNPQANSYVDYVRSNYEVLTTDPEADEGTQEYGFAEEPEYQIEILPGQLASGEPAPLYMDPTDEGWFLDPEQNAMKAPARDAPSGALTLDLDADAPALELEADEPPDGSFEGATNAYSRGGAVPELDFGETPTSDFASRNDEVTPGFGPEATPVGFNTQVTDVRKPNLGFVQPRAAEPPELKVTVRTPGAKPPPEPAREDPMTLRTPVSDLIDSLPSPRPAGPATRDLPDERRPPATNTPQGAADTMRPTGQTRPSSIGSDDTIKPTPQGREAATGRSTKPPDVVETTRAKIPTPAGSQPITRPPPTATRPPAQARQEDVARAATRPPAQARQEDVARAPTRQSMPPSGKSPDMAIGVAPTREFSSTPTEQLSHKPLPASTSQTKLGLGAAGAPTPADNGGEDLPSLTVPTRDLGLRPAGRAQSPTIDEEEPTKQSNIRQLRDEAARGRAEARDGTKSGSGGVALDPIDARNAQILNEVDADAPPDEGKEDRTRRRISSLIDRALAWNGISDYDKAVAAIDLALSEDPNSALAQKLIHRNRDTIMTVFQNYIGDLQRTPALAKPLHELANSPISPRAAFLLSRVDGTLSIDELLDVSGMPRLEAYRYLCQLFLRGILR